MPKVDEHHSNNLNIKENKSGKQSDQHKEIQICSSGSKHGSSDFKIENNLSFNMHSEFSTGTVALTFNPLIIHLNSDEIFNFFEILSYTNNE